MLTADDALTRRNRIRSERAWCALRVPLKDTLKVDFHISTILKCHLAAISKITAWEEEEEAFGEIFFLMIIFFSLSFSSLHILRIHKQNKKRQTSRCFDTKKGIRFRNRPIILQSNRLDVMFYNYNSAKIRTSRCDFSLLFLLCNWKNLCRSFCYSFKNVYLWEGGIYRRASFVTTDTRRFFFFSLFFLGDEYWI